VVASVPLDRYGSDAINQRLHDLDWVSRAAVAHERIVESFAAVTALLPMKLFTIFSGDDRARVEMTRRREEIDAALSRVAGHDEWGVRVVFDPAASEPKPRAKSDSRAKQPGGAEYLAMKKARRDKAAELAERSRDVATGLYDRLATRSTLARRRTAADLPAGGTLLMEGAFLVRRARTAGFRAAVSREARTLTRNGYQVTLTGPWPAYSFVQEERCRRRWPGGVSSVPCGR
jgi:hypothetical protein